MKKKYILALDQGTSSSRAIVFNSDFQIVGLHQKEFKQIYLNDSWVEHDPEDIWQSQYLSALEAIRDANISPEEIASIGITNQRETTIIWDRNTGKPVYNAIVWMCRRTSSICSKLEEDGYKDMIREKTGLIIDPYFSGTKIKWLLDNIPGIRQRAEKGDLMFGTVDSWLLYRLTGNREHKTDYTNASRTMLFNIKENRFDEELLKLLDIPGSLLPEVFPCNSIFGYTDPSLFGGVSIPIGGIAGDQHAALLGHGCIHEGMAKNTYGTGCFMLTNCGEKFVESKNGLLTTIAYNIDGKTIYALEGSIKCREYDTVAQGRAPVLLRFQGFRILCRKGQGQRRCIRSACFLRTRSTVLGQVCKRCHSWTYEELQQEPHHEGRSGIHSISG